MSVYTGKKRRNNRTISRPFVPSITYAAPTPTVHHNLSPLPGSDEYYRALVEAYGQTRVALVLALYRSGASVRRIARQTHFSEDAASRIVAHAKAAGEPIECAKCGRTREQARGFETVRGVLYCRTHARHAKGDFRGVERQAVRIIELYNAGDSQPVIAQALGIHTRAVAGAIASGLIPVRRHCASCGRPRKRGVPFVRGPFELSDGSIEHRAVCRSCLLTLMEQGYDTFTENEAEEAESAA